METTVPGGWPGGWLDQMEIRLTSASVEVEVELRLRLKAPIFMKFETYIHKIVENHQMIFRKDLCKHVRT